MENVAARSRCIRVFRGASLRFVYIEFQASGDILFWDEEPGEVRCYPFFPSPEERDALVDAARAGQQGKRLPPYVDLDIPPGSLAGAELVSLEMFRRFVHDHCDLSTIVGLDRNILEFLRRSALEKPFVTERQPKLHSSSTQEVDPKVPSVVHSGKAA